MTTNTGYFMLWAMHEARKALQAAEKGERRLGLLHLSNAWRYIGTASAGKRPAYLSRKGFWSRMSCIEQAADKAANELADLCMFTAAAAGVARDA